MFFGGSTLSQGNLFETMKANYLLVAALLAISTSAVSCSEAESSAEHVLENAGSVVRSGRAKLFMTPGPSEERRSGEHYREGEPTAAAEPPNEPSSRY